MSVWRWYPLHLFSLQYPPRIQFCRSASIFPSRSLSLRSYEVSRVPGLSRGRHGFLIHSPSVRLYRESIHLTRCFVGKVGFDCPYHLWMFLPFNLNLWNDEVPIIRRNSLPTQKQPLRLSVIVSKCWKKQAFCCLFQRKWKVFFLFCIRLIELVELGEFNWNQSSMTEGYWNLPGVTH